MPDARRRMIPVAQRRAGAAQRRPDTAGPRAPRPQGRDQRAQGDIHPPRPLLPAARSPAPCPEGRPRSPCPPCRARCRSLPSRAAGPPPPPARRARPAPSIGQWRPIYAVWEITLRCDLACRHCGSRAGRARPDELTTAEALDLVAPDGRARRAGGHAHRRRGLPARRLARDRPRRPRRAGWTCTMTTGGRGLTAERARAAQDAGIRARVGVGRRPARDARRAARAAGQLRRGAAAIEQPARRGHPASRPTPRSTGPTSRELRARLRAARRGRHPRLAGAAHGRDGPRRRRAGPPARALPDARGHAACWRGSRRAPTRPGAPLARQQHRLLRPATRRCCARTCPRGHGGSCGAGRAARSASRPTATSRAAPRCPPSDYVGGNVRDALACGTSGSARRRCASRATAPWRTSGATAAPATTPRPASAAAPGRRTCSSARPGNNPFCHHRALELLARGQARAPGAHAAPRRGMPFDYGRFEIVLEAWPEAERRLYQAMTEGPAAGHGGTP